MKNKKKGFTLIELLAVIVILAIIALIAVPIVLNLIEKSRKGTFTRSAESVLKASKIYYTSGLLEVETLEDIRFECSNNECISNKIGEPINLNVSGNIGEGYVVVTKEGEIEFKLQNGKYCAVKSKNNENVTLKEENCDKIDITNDKTAPEIKNISTVTSTNSIEVTVGAEDIESGISGYSYSIDGINYTEIQENNVYKFEGCSKDNEPYTVYVRVYNGTYGKDGYTEETGMSEGKKEGIELKTLETPTIIVSPEGWQRSKTVKIDYPEGEYIEEYSIDEGEWKTYEGEFTIDKNVTIVARISDGKNELYSPAITVVNIDDKEPSVTITYTKEDGNEYVIGNWSDQNVIVTVNAEDKNIDGSIGSGITKYEIIYDGQIVESNKVTINKEGTTLLKVKVTDGVDRILETEDVEIKIDKAAPEITYSISGGNYTEYQTLEITPSDTNLRERIVEVYKADTKIEEKSGINITSVSIDSDGTWKVITTAYDEAGKNVTKEETYVVDTTDPEVTIGVVTSTTNSITLPYTVTDNMSEITSKTCKYGTEYLKYTETGSINDKECVLNGLTKETKYYYQICATDALGNKGCAEGNSNSKTISAPVITESSTTPSTPINGYLKSQTLNVTYSSANITSPTYYIMSERAGRSNVNVIGTCGTGLEPGTCSASSTTTIVANTWYKVSGNISVTYDVTNATTKQYLYGRTTDGKNIATGNYEISKIDSTGPVNIEASVPTDWTSGNKTITASASDANVGTIGGYYISTGTTAPSASAAEWQTAATFSKGAGTYNIWSKDSLGNVSSNYKTVTVTNIETTKPTIDVTVANATTYAKSKTATITISDTTSGLEAGTYTIRYGWGTPSNPDTILCSSLGATTTITVDTTGTKSITKDVTVPNRTGEGKIFVCNSTAIKDDAGNSLAIDSKDYATMYLDNTGPTVTASVPTNWTSGNKTITASASDANVGTIGGYYISTGTTAPSASAAEWQTAATFSKGAGTYNIWAKDSLGNVSAEYATVTVTNIDTANPTTVVLSANSDSTYTKTKSVTVTLKDTGGSGLAAGKFKYGWSTSNSTQPSSYTEVSTSATRGTNTTTFKADGSGLTGDYYLWVVPVTYKDNSGRSNTTTVKSTGTFKFDNLGPVVTLSSATVTSNSITVPYTSVDGNVGTIGSTTCVYGKTTSYGSTGTVSGGKCVMSGLSAATTYYYKITSTDSLGNSTTNSVKTGSAKTTTSISGTPTITAAWPSTTQIKTTVSGVTSAGDTVSYRYSLNGTVKQDWSTSNTYTYTGLSGGKSYTIKVETKTTNSGITGNSKEATIYTSKTVTGTSEYSTNALCSNGSYSISATTVYNGTTLKSPSCSSSQKLVYSNTCNTSYSTTSSCASTRSCTVGGYTGTVSASGSTQSTSYGSWSFVNSESNLTSCSGSNSSTCSSCTSYSTCSSSTVYTKVTGTRTSTTVWNGSYSSKAECCSAGHSSCFAEADRVCYGTCGSNSSCQESCLSTKKSACNDSWHGGSFTCPACTSSEKYGNWTTSTSTGVTSCTNSNSSSCTSCTSYTACTPSTVYTKSNYTRTKTVTNNCNYSGTVNGYSTVYNGSFSGVVTPKQTTY